MWNEILQFAIEHGAMRVFLTSMLGTGLLVLSIFYLFNPGKYILPAVLMAILIMIIYPTFNYFMDFTEMNAVLPHANPEARAELRREIENLMAWHIWYPIIFIIPALLIITFSRLYSYIRKSSI